MAPLCVVTNFKTYTFEPNIFKACGKHGVVVNKKVLYTL
jgi:hypothetical protein